MTQSMKSQQPRTLIDIEVTGFGGDFGKSGLCVPIATNRCAPVGQ
ncbi:MAG TPA: hypothetical protein VGM68_11890 [Rhizomicrobium sp.]|jgi:hypothetical protein